MTTNEKAKLPQKSFTRDAHLISEGHTRVDDQSNYIVTD